MNTETEKLTQILKESNNIVFFGGAGVSTASKSRILEVLMVYLVKSLMQHLHQSN